MFYLLIIILLAMDQWIKLIIDKNLFPGESIPVINGFFHLTYVRNTGAGFGILSGYKILLIIITIIILIGLLVYRYKTRKTRLKEFFFVFLISGAVGNLIDRIRLSYVIDYLDFRIWPVFNLADIMVNIGVGLLIIYIWKSEGDIYKEE